MMEKAILYSTGCPNCKMLEHLLDRFGIDYEMHTDPEEMKALGFQSAPMLQAEGKTMNFVTAVKWVQGVGG